MIIFQIAFQNPSQMLFSQDDDMIQAVASDRSDQPLHVGPLPWAGRCGENFLHAQALDSLAKVTPIDPIPVSQQVPWCRVLRKRLYHLLPGPSSRRMLRHVEVNDTPAIMSQYHQHEQHPKGSRRHGEEVDRDQNKNGRYYMVKFMWQGRMIRKSTRCTNAKDARTVEGKIRSELGRGNWGVLDSKPRLTLAELLKDHFLPFVETEFKTKPNSRDYYVYGAANLLASDLAALQLDCITGQHVTAYIAQHGRLKATTINRDLRTLRRALSLAVEWGKLDRMPKVTLAKGENRRERVLTEAEVESYLAACRQPWRDVATLIVGEGMRPGECYALRWEHVLLNGDGGLIQVARGKSKAARRPLPMVPAVYRALKARHEAQGFPTEGWVFPTASVSGHMEESSAKTWHSKALAKLVEARKEDPETNPEVKPFEPYCLRHTFGTRLAPKCDVFALARIMGHSSVRTTERYVHPQETAIERAFQKLVTDGGHRELLPATSDAEPVEVNKAESEG